MKIPIFPGKYHQHGGFSMAMLVYRRVQFTKIMIQDYPPNMSTPFQLSAGVLFLKCIWPFYSYITTLQLLLFPWPVNFKHSINLTASLQLKLHFKLLLLNNMFSHLKIFLKGEAERLSLCALLHAKHHGGAIAQRAMQRKLSCRETPRRAKRWGVRSLRAKLQVMFLC